MSNVPSSPTPASVAAAPVPQDTDVRLIVSLLKEQLMPLQEQLERMRFTLDELDRRSDRMEYRVEDLEESARRGLISPNRVSERILSSGTAAGADLSSSTRTGEDDSSEGDSMMAGPSRVKVYPSKEDPRTEDPPPVAVPEARFEVDFEVGGRKYQIHRRRDSFTGATLPRTPAVNRQGAQSATTDGAKAKVHFNSTPDPAVDPFEPVGNLESLGEMLDGSDFHTPRKSGGQRPDTSSYLDRQYLQVDKVTESYQPTFFKSEPPHNILLTSLTLASVIRFVDDVLDYQYRYGVRLRVGTLIKSNVAQELVDRLEGLTLPILLIMPTRYVFKTLQLEICPTTSYEFYNRMEVTVKFNLSVPKGYRPSPGEYKPFYNALLNYRKQFVRAYDILVTFAEPQVIPPFNTKRFGLIKLFLDKIPYDYGYRLHQSDLEHKLVSREITHIYQYVKCFFAHVTNHFETYRQVRIMGQHFGGSDYAAGDNLARRPSSTFVRPHQPRHQSVSHVTALDNRYDTPESDDPRDDSNAFAYDNPPEDEDLHMDPYAAPEPVSSPFDEEEDDDLLVPPPEEAATEDDLFYDHVDDPPATLSIAPQLHAMPAHKDDRRPQRFDHPPKVNTDACRAAAMAKDGRCPKQIAGQRCIYNHDKTALRAEHRRLVSALAASPFASDTKFVPQSTKDNPRQFQAIRRPPPPPGAPQVLSNSFPPRKSP